jgi:hypothetical protein
MASKSLKRFRGRLTFVGFFLLVVEGCFCWVFGKFWLQNVVFWMVKRGDVVVFCVAGSGLFSLDENTPTF